MVYFAKTPRWLKKVYSSCIWDFYTSDEKVIYLTFDDGPHPVITKYVLDELDKYNAKATFFCIGKNVAEQNETYQQIINNGHSVGNHTYDHFNGWKTPDVKYLQNIAEAAKIIDSALFRPPYGRVKRSQLKQIRSVNENMKVIMWSVLSGDFDTAISKEKCLENVIENTTSGSIVVLHDSEKAFNHLQYSLPRILQYFSERGYSFKNIAV